MMKIKGLATYVLILLVGVFLLVELVARFYLGLGDPPLMMEDPQLEYVYRPSSSYRRFGNHVSFNSYSMRSDEISRTRESVEEVRVLMIGDSILEAGTSVDQSKIASELFKTELSQQLLRPVVVGNASAKSWGPPNMLAYVNKYGFFDADVVMLLLSSHDAFDVPTFQKIVGVDPNFPAEKPLFAVLEGVHRYLPRYMPFLGAKHKPAAVSVATAADEAQQLKSQSITALKQLIQNAKATGAKVMVLQHLEKAEIGKQVTEGHLAIREAATESGALVVQVGPHIEREIDQGRDPYLDAIHVNEVGQAAIARAMLDGVIGLLEISSETEKIKEFRDLNTKH